MNLLTSLALLGFVSRALAHAQLVLLSEMQQENATNPKSTYAPSHLPLLDAVSTEFASLVDETISDVSDVSYAGPNEGLSDLINSSSSSSSNEQASIIPSGATQLPGLHGRTPLIWRWNEAINQTVQGRGSNRRVQRKSNDFTPRSSADCTKNVDERSDQRATDYESDRSFTSRDALEDETLNQRTGADRRSPSNSRSRPNNRGSEESRFDHSERRRDTDSDETDWVDENVDDSEPATTFTRRRNQNRRKPLKNVDGESDGADEREDNYRPDVDEDKLDRRRDSSDDDEDDDEIDDNSRRSSHSTSSRRNNNRNRGYNRQYPYRRRNSGYRGDSDTDYRKPYAKRPIHSDPPNKPYPKDSTPQASRRFKNHKKPYSAPRPAGFPNANAPASGEDAIPFGNTNNQHFINFGAAESPDDLINLEDGATILDTHTGQTYEISIADARSAPVVAVPFASDHSLDQAPYASLKANYGAKPTPGASIDSILQLIRTNQPALTFVEPVSA